MTTKTTYDRALLDQIIARDGATLVGNYDKLNRESVINFKCKCGSKHQKNFRVANKSNVICSKCTKQNRELKREKKCL